MCYVYTERIINARALRLSHDRMQDLKIVPYNNKYLFHGQRRIIAPSKPLRHFVLLSSDHKLPAFILVVRASRRGLGLPSDPEFLLELMQELPDESESEDEFDGYLDPEDGPIMLRRSDREEELDSPLTRARSLDSPNDAQGLLDQDVESPLGSSPSLSPMQVVGGSPTHSPMQQTATQLEPRTAALTSPTHSPMQQTATQLDPRTAALTSPTPPSLRVSIAQSQKIM